MSSVPSSAPEAPFLRAPLRRCVPSSSGRGPTGEALVRDDEIHFGHSSVPHELAASGGREARKSGCRSGGRERRPLLDARASR